MIAEQYKIVPVMNSTDIGAGTAGDSICMRDYHKATFIITMGAVAGASLVVQIFSGAGDGDRTTALAFEYAYGGAAIGTAVAGSEASSDVLAAWATAATTGVAVGDTSYDNFMLVCEINASAMDTADNEEWLTIYPNGGSSGVMHIVAILEPRYPENRIYTCLAY